MLIKLTFELHMLNNIINMVVDVLETCASSLSFDSLPWRRVTVRAPPSLSSYPAKAPPSGQIREGGLAGGYGYRDAALPSSTCRNRFILWQCCEGCLKLLEVSLDIQLVHNALQLDLEGVAGSTPFLLPDVTVHEYDRSSVVMLFATSSAVYRLTLPHPNNIVKTPNLMSHGEGLMPSVLAFASEQNFIGQNMATSSDQLGSNLVVSSCASCISPTGQATFALSSPSGGIHVIQLSPPGANRLPVRSVLRVSSMMTKLWTSLMPAVIKGSGGGEADDAPVSMALHLFDGMEIILALCKDLNLRIWSCQLSQCVMTHNMANYLQIEEDSDAKVDKLLLRKSPSGTDASLRFAVHIRTGGYSQISIFQLFLINSQLVLRPFSNYTCPMNSSLVDFSLTNRELCGVWVCRSEDGEGEETVIKKALYDDAIPGFWQTVKLLPDPPAEVTVLQQKDPREAYLEAIFYPGRFASSAISRTLELYGVSEVEEGQLPTITTIKVEAELHASACSQELSHDEYRDLCMQCWTKFYGCCNEYHKLLSQPLGVFLDPGTGMGLILKKGMASFLRPDDVMIKITFNDEYESKDLHRFVKCMKDLCATVNDDVLDTFLIELGYRGHPPPITMATDIAAALHEEGGDTGVASQLSSVDIETVLCTLIKALDQAGNDADNSMEEDGIDYQYQTVAAQLFASPIATTILGSALEEVCHSRAVFCRDLLILLCVLKYNSVYEAPPTLNSKFIPRVSTLLLNYSTLHWLTTATPFQPTHTSYDANLKQMASLEISSHSSRHVPGCESTLARLYLSAGGHQDLTSELIKGRVLPMSSSAHPHWTNLIPKIVDILLTKLWPMTSSCNVSKFLLSTCQYTYLQEFLSRITQFVTSVPFSRAFLLGHAHLSIGELEKALQCFVMATGGIDDPSESVLQSVCGSGAGEAGDGGRRVQYYVKVMRLFEQVPSPSYVVMVTKIATKLVNRDHPNAAVLWSNLFKYELELGHSQGAYQAMMDNPDPVRKRDCLHRLIVVLSEKKKRKELCAFTYSGMEEEVEKIIELRARSVDITKHDYYNLLYCFHVCRSNYRKAAYAMFEYGLRLGRESSDPKSLQKQANCYAATLNALSLTEEKYAWVIKPVEPDEPPKSSRRKRPKSSQKGPGKRPVEVLTKADLQKEYLLVKAKLRLLKKEPTLATQLTSPFVSADEVTSLLAQAGLFELAIDISKRFSLSMVPVFEALAARCVHLSTALRQASGDMSVYWDWLELNQSTHIATSRENSLATKAWGLLRQQLEKNSDVSGTLQRCVARKLITMGAQLPQWLVERYKTSNPAELLRMYLTFDLIEPATLLAMEFIDAVCGHGKEFFGLEAGLHATSPCVWLPYSTLDHLHQALQTIPIHSPLKELANNFNSKLEGYFQTVDEVSQSKKEGARQPATHSYAASSSMLGLTGGDGDDGGGGDHSPSWSVSSSSDSSDNAMY